ncbi:hypothetical protein KAT80_00075 [Candidatus Pacearchaeota archaeon]|nr:hypothetical protein [Candidatus Pacearchaeota archaeon]
MGLLKSLVKIGFGGVVAGAVVNSAVKKAHQTTQERYDEKILWSKGSYNYQKGLNINPSKISKVYDFLIRNSEKSGFEIDEKDKPNSFSFKKGSNWVGGKQTISFNLEKINKKILLTINTKWHFGSSPQGKDYKEFMEESESLAILLQELF